MGCRMSCSCRWATAAPRAWLLCECACSHAHGSLCRAGTQRRASSTALCALRRMQELVLRNASLAGECSGPHIEGAIALQARRAGQ